MVNGGGSGWRQMAVVAVAMLATVVALAGCSGRDAAKVDGSPPAGVAAPSPESGSFVVSEAVVEGLEQAIGDGLTRWESDAVGVSVSGTPTARDLDIVDATLAAFAPLTAITFSRVATDGDIDIAFVATDTWPPSDEPANGDGGFTSDTPVDDLGLTTWEADFEGVITEAQVYVDPAISQALRNSTISHELTHALGLGHVECVTSIIDDGTQLDLDWVPTPFDETLIGTWYDADVALLTTRGELRNEIEIGEGGAECAPWLIEGVAVEGEVLACEVAFADYRSCMAYDGLGPLPSLEAWTPTAWVDDESVYDYDPARYEEFDVDGERVLCELEPGDRRRPCQITQGSGPISDPSLWTDGEYVYDNP